MRAPKLLPALVLTLVPACDDPPKDSAAPKKTAAKSDQAAPAPADPTPADAKTAKPGPGDKPAPDPGDDAKGEATDKDPKIAPADPDAAGADSEHPPGVGTTTGDDRAVRVEGLPPEKPWTAAGPFAAAKFKSGALAITPKEAGDGELPHEPEKGVEEDTGTFMGHPTAFGWAKDGKTFVLCLDLAGDAPDCTLTGADGSQESFSDEARMKKELAAAKPAAGPTSWAHGGEVQLSWTTTPHATGQTLRVHATASADVVALEVARMTFGDISKEADVFPELLSLNADGSLLAIVGHAWEGEGSDAFQIRIVGTGWLAAEAYNKAGLSLLKAGDAKAAAARFIQASVADPTMWKAPFNAACAHAKSGDVRAKSTLAEALTRGGDKAKAKAKTDEDLAAVRKEPWFQTLVGG